MFQTWVMTDPILYLSMLLGLGGVYVLISSFHDDDDNDDGEKYIYNQAHLDSLFSKPLATSQIQFSAQIFRTLIFKYF